MACSVLNINNFYSTQNTSLNNSKTQKQFFQDDSISSQEKTTLNQLFVQKSESDKQSQRKIHQSTNNTYKQISIKSNKYYQYKNTYNSINKNKIITNNAICDKQNSSYLLKTQQLTKQEDQYYYKFIKSKSKTGENVYNRSSFWYQYESDSESEGEEFSIWDESVLKNSGVDIDNFIDDNGTQLGFYQIYRLRSALYQPQYISRIETIKEVQKISSHYNKEISINELKQQQNYLDTHFKIQKKENEQVQQQNKQQSSTKILNQNKKCLSERISRTQSQYVQRNQILSQKLQNNQKVIQDEINSSREKNLECFNALKPERNYKQKNQEVLKQDFNKQQDNIIKRDPQIYKLNHQNTSTLCRQKLRISCQQTQKLIENKKIPIRQITLQDNNSLSQDDFSPISSPKSNLIQNERKIEQQYQISELNLNQIAWSIQPPSSSQNIASSDFPCQSIVRIDVYASSDQIMRIFNVNDLSKTQSFDCYDQTIGLFYNQYDDVMISACSQKITIWNKLNQNSNNQYTSVQTYSSPANISIIQQLNPLKDMTFLASSSNPKSSKLTLYLFKYQNDEIDQLNKQIFSDKAIFKSLGQMIAVMDKEILTFYDSKLNFYNQISQKFLGLDYLKFQNQLILYDSKKVYIYNANFVIQQCILPCQTCLDSDFSLCLSCNNPSYHVVNSKFQCVCQENQYMVSNYSCLNCDQSCKTCSDSTTCLTCQQGKVLYQNLCQDKCPDEYFLDSENKCQKCPNNCDQFDQSGKCSKCQVNFYLDPNKKCVSSCPDQYYPDNNNICQSCLPNCSKCTSSTQCTKCLSNFNLFQNQQCLTTCPDKYFPDNDNICQQCTANCSQCNSPTQCSKCSADYVLSKNFQCIHACADSYYLDYNDVCQQCLSNCSQCSSSIKCGKCLSSFYLHQNSKCLNACPDQFYPDNKNVCQPCLLNCSQCISQTSCNKCLPNFFLVQNSQCLNTCPDQYYQDQAENKCQQCSTSFCKSCDNNNNCQQCLNNYFLKGNQCVLSCGPGYQQLNNSCVACRAQNCLQCKRQIDQRSSCLVNFDFFNNKCIPSCDSNQIRDSNCKCIENIQFSLISKNNNQILMIFKSKLNLENIQQHLNIDIPQLQKQFDYKISVQDEYSLAIAISTNQIINEDLKVKISINQQASQQQDAQQSISIKIQGQGQDKNPTATQSLETATQVVSTATITAIFPLMLSGNFWMIASILDISQIIYMTSFIDFKTSSSLDTFLSSQRNFKIPFPNFFEYIDHYEKIEYKTPDKISEKNIQGFYLSNMEVILCLKEIFSETWKLYFKLKRMKKKQLTIVPHNEEKIKEDDPNLVIKRNSCMIQDIQSAAQQQNAYNDQSPTKLDDQSPTKLDSKQLISFMAEQSALRFELDSPHKRILRSAKRLQEQDIKCQVHNNQSQNWGTILRVSQSQYDIQNEPLSAQEFKIIQTNRSSSALILEDNKISSNNFIIGELEKMQVGLDKKQILIGNQSVQEELNDQYQQQQFGIYNQQSCTNL
ncbi:hypothetical protein ABPG72_019866 [Tetrahymena utriculariae]